MILRFPTAKVALQIDTDVESLPPSDTFLAGCAFTGTRLSTLHLDSTTLVKLS